MTKADKARLISLHRRAAKGYLEIIRQAGAELELLEKSRAKARAARAFLLSDTWETIKQYREEAQ